MYKENTKREDLDGTIEFLTNTAQITTLFTDQRVFRSITDERLERNREVLHWFQDWHGQPGVDYRKNFLTRECYEDLKSMIIGFESMVKKLRRCPLGTVCAHRINTDIVENFFSAQRGVNGSSTNPTYLQYSKNVNTIVIGQKVISKKSNANQKICVGGALPYKIHTKQSFRKCKN